MSRRCKDCNALLSSYNRGLLCWPCEDKKKEYLERQIGDIQYYTVNNLAFLLGFVNSESVKRLGRKGKIPGRIPGIKQHLYLRKDVDLWIHGNQQQTSTDVLIEQERKEDISSDKTTQKITTVADLKSRDGTDKTLLSPSLTITEVADLESHRVAIKQIAKELSEEFERPPFSSFIEETITAVQHLEGIGRFWVHKPKPFFAYDVISTGKILVPCRLETQEEKVPILQLLMQHVESPGFSQVKRNFEIRREMGGNILDHGYWVMKKVERAIKSSQEIRAIRKDTVYWYGLMASILYTAVKCTENLEKILDTKYIFAGNVGSLWDLTPDIFDRCDLPYLLIIDHRMAASANSHNELLVYQNAHKVLAEKFSRLPETKELAALVQAMDEHDKILSSDLYEFTKSVKVPGFCKYCETAIVNQSHV